MQAMGKNVNLGILPVTSEPLTQITPCNWSKGTDAIFLSRF
jgi:hypothetical protein